MSPVKSDREHDKPKVDPKPDTDDQPFGSVLGVIDSDPTKKLPQVAKDRGGHPQGIDVRTENPLGNDLTQFAGYSSDFGAGPQDHDDVQQIPRNRPGKDEEEEEEHE